MAYRIRHGRRKGRRTVHGRSSVWVHPLRRRQGGLGIVRLLLRRQWLPMRTVELDVGIGASTALRVAQMRVGGVRGDKGLRLRRDRGEHALLVEALAVGATAVRGVFESRATNL